MDDPLEFRAHVVNDLHVDRDRQHDPAWLLVAAHAHLAAEIHLLRRHLLLEQSSAVAAQATCRRCGHIPKLHRSGRGQGAPLGCTVEGCDCHAYTAIPQ